MAYAFTYFLNGEEKQLLPEFRFQQTARIFHKSRYSGMLLPHCDWKIFEQFAAFGSYKLGNKSRGLVERSQQVFTEFGTGPFAGGKNVLFMCFNCMYQFL